MEPIEYTVGVVAESTGISVRTLHHYDEIGLLRPSGRTGLSQYIHDAILANCRRGARSAAR